MDWLKELFTGMNGQALRRLQIDQWDFRVLTTVGDVVVLDEFHFTSERQV